MLSVMGRQLCIKAQPSADQMSCLLHRT